MDDLLNPPTPYWQQGRKERARDKREAIASWVAILPEFPAHGVKIRHSYRYKGKPEVVTMGRRYRRKVNGRPTGRERYADLITKSKTVAARRIGQLFASSLPGRVVAVVDSRTDAVLWTHTR